MTTEERGNIIYIRKREHEAQKSPISYLQLSARAQLKQSGSTNSTLLATIPRGLDDVHT